MRDYAVQITWLVAMVTKNSVATITGNYCFSQKACCTEHLRPQSMYAKGSTKSKEFKAFLCFLFDVPSSLQ